MAYRFFIYTVGSASNRLCVCGDITPTKVACLSIIYSSPVCYSEQAAVTHSRNVHAVLLYCIFCQRAK
jgi:hypothetical protein